MKYIDTPKNYNYYAIDSLMLYVSFDRKYDFTKKIVYLVWPHFSGTKESKIDLCVYFLCCVYMQ